MDEAEGEMGFLGLSRGEMLCYCHYVLSATIVALFFLLTLQCQVIVLGFKYSKGSLSLKSLILEEEKHHFSL